MFSEECVSHSVHMEGMYDVISCLWSHGGVVCPMVSPRGCGLSWGVCKEDSPSRQTSLLLVGRHPQEVCTPP